MKRILTLTLTTIFLLFLVTDCDRPEGPSPQSQEFGYLSLSVALQIEALPASGRIETVSPDDFIVTIHNDDGTIFLQWDNYSDVPSEVQLPTGSYYISATSLASPEDAAFEQPWYYGESDVFTIDKEELETIDVECTLANCKISFTYSQNVLDNFTNWDATATIDDGNGTGAFLEWIQDDPAEGYFLTDLPIDIEVFLEYVKLTDPDQSITRTFNHTISDPTPATHYLINVDASLEDGKIMINITVDDEFETVEIPLGDENEGDEEPNGETIADIDGNVYTTVQIGDQLWMGENLEVTRYNDGLQIPHVQSADDWAILTSPAYSRYNNGQGVPDYGLLYNWFTVETGKLCPAGWHIPSHTEWNALANFLGGPNSAGGKLKEVGTTNWLSPNTGATNETGFTALPGGDRLNSGSFHNINNYGFWWSSTPFQENYARNKGLFSNNSVLGDGIILKNMGYSVRCLKD